MNKFEGKIEDLEKEELLVIIMKHISDCMCVHLCFFVFQMPSSDVNVYSRLMAYYLVQNKLYVKI